MIKMNVSAVLAKEAERKAQVVPLPKIRIVAKRKPEANAPGISHPVYLMPIEDHPENVAKNDLLMELNAEFIAVKKQRAVLSSQTWKMVRDIEERLRRENPVALIPFQEGNMPMPELADHWAKIEAFTDQGAKIFDDIRYVEHYGKLPGAASAIPSESLSEEVKSIHYEIRRLDDRIYKTKKKLELQKAKNPNRIAVWNEKIALDEAKRTDLKHKLKKLQYEARAERPGEG